LGDCRANSARSTGDERDFAIEAELRKGIAGKRMDARISHSYIPVQCCSWAFDSKNFVRYFHLLTNISGRNVI
jgi:hypothetical protein